MTQTQGDLLRLGDALERAAVADLGRRRGTKRRPRRMTLVVAMAFLASGGAYAAAQFVSGDSVAKSLPAGTLALAGTTATCVEATGPASAAMTSPVFDCTLDRAPAPEVPDWTGTLEPSVDATRHINGGCRSLNAEGTMWRCYLGQDAVRQKIIDAGLLGRESAGPGAG